MGSGENAKVQRQTLKGTTHHNKKGAELIEELRKLPLSELKDLVAVLETLAQQIRNGVEHQKERLDQVHSASVA